MNTVNTLQSRSFHSDFTISICRILEETVVWATFQFQYEMPESPTTAMNSERPWGEMDDSRRSSLRSTSIYDMDGTGYTAGSKQFSTLLGVIHKQRGGRGLAKRPFYYIRLI